MDNQIVILVDIKGNLKGLRQDFKEWIEQTHLFNVIKRFVGTGLELNLLPTSMQLHLTRNIPIEKAEDLPIELIQEFYRNSPFYTDSTFIQKQIENNK